jgi:hypothetical protein
MPTMLLPLTIEEHLARLESNLRRFHVPRIGKPRPDHDGKLIVCGFGPSLVDTWPQIAEAVAAGAKVVTTSGAHDFLIGKGIVPTYHVELDPREHKVFFLRNPHPDVTYCIGSTCHPKMFARLRRNRVLMCHFFLDDRLDDQVALVLRYDAVPTLLCGGTNAGQRAIIVGRHFGHKSFVLHGMDCSYRGPTLWAGAHSGKRHDAVQVRCNGRIFDTSDSMMQSTDDFFQHWFTAIPDCRFEIAGDGLLAERFKIFQRDPALAWSSAGDGPTWWEPIGFQLKSA